MVRVKIDVSTLDSTNLTGIGTYIKQLIAALREIPDVELTGSFRLSRMRKQEVIRQHVPGLPLRVYVPVLDDIRPTPAGVFHGPDFRIPTGKRCRKVVTIHDMGHLDASVSSEEFRARMRTRMDRNILGHKPDFIIAVSDFTRQQVLSTYPEYKDRIRRIYLGADHLEPAQSEMAPPFEFPYVLFVGSLERRKNLHGLIDAFDNLDPSLKDTRLVIAGGAGTNKAWTAEILRRIQSARSKDRIKPADRRPSSSISSPSIAGNHLPTFRIWNVGASMQHLASCLSRRFHG